MADRELWRLKREAREVVCSVAEIRDPKHATWDTAPIGFELRVERDGDLHLTELHRNRAAIDLRSEHLRELMLRNGWAPN
jgi:hypothetical protein